MLGDPELKNCKEGDIIQLQRRGFFRVDRPYAPPSVFSGVASPVVLFEIPDGHQKAAATATPIAKPTATQSSTPAPKAQSNNLHEKIAKQGNIVRDLKAAKAEKPKIEEAVKSLLALKAEFKAATGKDWTPGATPEPQATTVDADLNEKIIKQGNLVRDLKSKKAEKAKIDEAVKGLLGLKNVFKAATGKDWAPGIAIPAATSATAPAQSKPSAQELDEDISKQGSIVRDLKSSKAEKAKIDSAVKELLSLKGEFKTLTGKDWTPGITVPATATAPSSANANELNEKIAQQGNAVRDLKSKKAEKSKVDEAVKLLLALKAEFKNVSGKDWTPGSAPLSDISNNSAANQVNKILYEFYLNAKFHFDRRIPT